MISAMIAFLQWKNSKVRLRSRLKTDLEIMELMGDDHDQLALVQSNINETIEKVYKHKDIVDITLHGLSARASARSWVTALTFVLLFAAAVWWTLSLVREPDGSFEWSWWVLLSGYLALACIYGIILPFTPEFQARQRAKQDRLGEKRL